jgi:hypothetical protein
MFHGMEQQRVVSTQPSSILQHSLIKLLCKVFCDVQVTVGQADKSLVNRTESVYHTQQARLLFLSRLLPDRVFRGGQLVLNQGTSHRRSIR